MPGLPRMKLSGVPSHLVQQGNNRQTFFHRSIYSGKYRYWPISFN